MAQDTFLVTGSTGCIGSWTVRNLLDQGANVVTGHTSGDFHRIEYLMTAEEMDRIKFVKFDIGDLDALTRLIEDNRVNRIIHLAGLQVPFCKANPVQGAWVNVTGMVNVLEAARRFGDQVEGLAYASSVAVLGPKRMYPDRPVGDDVPLRPETLYGVYKMADEHLARVYFNDYGVKSVGVRPAITYGVGRDQGMTSDVSKAILAAAAGQAFKLNFSGKVCLQYNDDAAKMFIAAAKCGFEGAPACNLRNDVIEVADFIDRLTEQVPGAEISFVPDQPLPFPMDLGDDRLRELIGEPIHTPLDQVISDSLALYKKLLDQGRIDLSQLG